MAYIINSFLALWLLFAPVHLVFADTPANTAAAGWDSWPVDPSICPAYAQGNTYFYLPDSLAFSSGLGLDSFGSTGGGVQFSMVLNQVNLTAAGSTLIQGQSNILPVSYSLAQIDAFMANSCSALHQFATSAISPPVAPCWYDSTVAPYAPVWVPSVPTVYTNDPGGATFTQGIGWCGSMVAPDGPAGDVDFGTPCLTSSDMGGGSPYGMSGPACPGSFFPVSFVNTPSNNTLYATSYGPFNPPLVFPGFDQTLTYVCMDSTPGTDGYFQNGAAPPANPDPPTPVNIMAEASSLFLGTQSYTVTFLPTPYFPYVAPPPPPGSVYAPDAGALAEIKAQFSTEMASCSLLTFPLLPSSTSRGVYTYLGNTWCLEDAKLLDLTPVTTIVWGFVAAGIVFRFHGKKRNRRVLSL